MHITFRRAAVAVTLLAGAGLALRPLWVVPSDAHFVAPHQSGIRSFVSRIELNSRVPKFAIKILYAAVPTVYASCPACDGTKSEPVNGTYCAPNNQCAEWGCDQVGGKTLCQTYTNNCIVGKNKYPCPDSNNASCQ